MAAPFCTACGAAVAEGTRFCVKCGQQVEQPAAPSFAETAIFPRPVVPPPPPPMAAPIRPSPPPPPPPVAQAPVAPPPFMPPPVAQPMPVREGAGAGVWIGIFGILLLVVGAGLWFYTTRVHQVSTVQVAVAPVEVTPTPAPTPTPASSTFVPAPTPSATPEVIPPNPDQPPKQAAQPGSRVNTPVSSPAPPADPAPPPPAPVKAARPTSGLLHAAVEVAQNGEVVFDNLPGGRLKFTFDHSAWQPTISRQANGTQTLVMRSLKPGIQTVCDVRWEIVQ